jgi:hypothetical protein
MSELMRLTAVSHFSSRAIGSRCSAIPGEYLSHWKQKTYILCFRKHYPSKINDICFFECLEQGNFSVSCWKIWLYLCESSNFNFFKFKHLSAFRELLSVGSHYAVHIHRILQRTHTYYVSSEWSWQYTGDSHAGYFCISPREGIFQKSEPKRNVIRFL